MYTIYAIIYQIDELNWCKGQYWHVYHGPFMLSFIRLMNWTDAKDSIYMCTTVHLCYHLSDWCITVRMTISSFPPFPRFHHFLVSYFLFPNFPFLVLSIPPNRNLLLWVAILSRRLMTPHVICVGGACILWVRRVIWHVIGTILSTQLECTHSWTADCSKV